MEAEGGEVQQEEEGRRIEVLEGSSCSNKKRRGGAAVN